VTYRARSWVGTGVIGGVLLGICAPMAAVTLSPARARAGTGPSPCSAAHTVIWVGMGGGSGFAGGYGLPLEFSNVGRRSCTLYGYPGVSADRGTRQVGPAATRLQERHSVVTLAAGASAHAFLRVTDTGALCGGRGATADALKVYAPGQRSSQPVLISVQVCPHRATLAVGAVKRGVGIPGYVTQ